MSLNSASTLLLYPENIIEKGSSRTNARTDVATIGDLTYYLQTPVGEGGAGILSIPGNLGNSSVLADLDILQTLVSIGFDMSWATFEGRTFPEEFDYSNGKFFRASFNGATFPAIEDGANSFVGANLQRAILAAAEIHTVDFTSADMSGAILAGAIIASCTMSEANLSGAFLDGTIITDTTFNETNFTGAVIKGATFDADCNLDTAIFDGAVFSDGVGLTELSAQGASFIGAIIDGSLTESCNFSGSNFTDAVLGGVGLDFGNSTLDDCLFIRANFATPGSINGCTVNGANFTHSTGWTSTDINSALEFVSAVLNDTVIWEDGVEYVFDGSMWVLPE